MSASPLDLPSPQTLRERRARFWIRGMRSAGFGAVIGLIITGLTGHSLWTTMVHSLCISMLCWFFIDLGRMPAARWQHRHAPAGTPQADSAWPGWPLMLVVVVVGSILGFTLGGMPCRMAHGPERARLSARRHAANRCIAAQLGSCPR